MQGRQFERERLPIGIQDRMDEKLWAAELGSDRKRVRGRGPIGLVKFGSMPGVVRSPKQFDKAFIIPCLYRASQSALGVQQRNEPMQIGMDIDERPIEPARLIVLDIGVIVATLASPDFVAHEDHRHADGKNSDGKKILHLPNAQLLYRRVVGWTFDAAVPAAIVICAVSIV